MIERTYRERKSTLKVLGQNKVIVTKPKLFPVNQEFLSEWFRNLQEQKLEERGIKKTKKTRKYDLIFINGDKYNMQIFFYAHSNSHKFVRVMTNEKKSRKQSIKTGLVSAENFNVFFRRFNSLRKKQYRITDTIKESFYFPDKNGHRLNLTQQDQLISLVESIRANAYAYSGRMTGEVKDKLGLGLDTNNGISGYFKLVGQNTYRIYFGRNTSEKRARVWIRGDIEVLEGPFPRWNELHQLKDEIVLKK